MRRPSDWADVLGLAGDPTPGDPEAISDTAEHYRDLADDSQTASRQVKALGGDTALLSWIGLSGDAYSSRFGELYEQLVGMWEDHSVVGDVLQTYAVRVRGDQADADRALRDGRDAQARLQSSQARLGAVEHRLAQVSSLPLPRPFVPSLPFGQLDTFPPLFPNLLLADAKADVAAAQRAVDSAEQELDDARRRAIRAGQAHQDSARLCSREIRAAEDANVSQMLSARWALLRARAEDSWESFLHPRLTPGEQGAHDLKALLDSMQGDSPQARAQAVAEWFASLDEEQRQALLAQDPELIGNLDGVPPELRYAANTQRVLAELAKTRAALANFKESEEGTADAVADVFLAQRRWNDRERLAFLEARVQMLEKLAAPSELLDLATGQSGGPRQFLLFDPSGDGRVAEVFGDLGSAEHVAVMVPGITNELNNYGGMVKDAKALSRRLGTSGAVIAWLGYDTPEFDNGARTLGRAQTGEGQLRGFVAGLKPFTDGSTTVLAHSYGSTVTGLALQNGLDVDNVVVFGSPGMATGNIDGLHLPTGTRFYALRAEGDHVSYSRNFGTDPADPAFGGTRLATGDLVSGHSKYYLDDSESMNNIVAVVNGRPEALTTTDTSLFDEGGWPVVVERGVIGQFNGRTSEIEKGFAATAISGIKDVAGNVIADVKDAAQVASDAASAAAVAAQLAQQAVTDAAIVAGQVVADVAVEAALAAAEAAAAAAIAAQETAAAAARVAQGAARVTGIVAEAVVDEVGEAAEAVGDTVADAAGDATRAAGAGARKIWEGITP